MSDYAITVLLIVSLAAIAGGTWLSALPKIRSRRLASLANSQERLKMITAELMEKANDLDQHMLYLEGSKTSAQGQKLKSALDDLVILSDTLPTIDQLIKERRIDDTNDMLSASCRLAEKVKDLLADVKRGTNKETSGSAKKGQQVVDVEVID